MPGQHRRAQLRALLRRVGLAKLDAALVEQAFVHESAVREGAAEVSNERLEFLGDAVLGVATARWLFERYPQAREGELALRKASLVSDVALAATAARLGFGPLLVVGRGLAKAPAYPQPSLLADAFEAFVACVFLKASLDAAAGFVIAHHLVLHEAENPSLVDAKTALQEFAQARFGAPPRYTERASGPPHAREFVAEAFVDGEALGSGKGPSKKEAQRAAAASALGVLEQRFGDNAAPGTRAKPTRTAKTKNP